MRGVRRLLILPAGLLAGFILMVATRPDAWAQSLVADLSSHLIAITTGFTGTDVVLFGAVDGEGDVAVVVQGPEGEVTVRHKDRVAGIWINTDEIEFARVPAFYTVALSNTLDGVVPPAVLQRHEIGLDYIRLAPVKKIDKAEKLAEYRAALIRNKQRMGLYTTEVGEVSFLGQRLFRTRIYFPANVPTGTYTASVFLIRDGDVVSAQTTPLLVSKIGFSASVAEFAQRQSVFYAVLGILLAVSLGWLAGIIFRKS
ncbi:TIGR02186 family protein [Niveispirillum irakense]|uniref:TIGR02186 family protein n=1 Tax=Niveispirillum irakense TaxID=34011 RepID=UPI00041571EE|nr:TIGR02186 family protein [Niveispirillum irakense]